MKKNTPHYRLDAIKAEVSAHGLDAFTRAAHGAELLGLTDFEAVAVVLNLERGMLLKSMTTHADYRMWQDVYHAICPNGRIAYIKLTLRTDGPVVIQFKEK